MRKATGRSNARRKYVYLFFVYCIGSYASTLTGLPKAVLKIW